MPSASTASTGRRIPVVLGLPDSSDSVPFGTEANGLAQLDSSGLLPTACLPNLSLTSVTTVANQTARLALTAQPGDVAIQTDTGTTYILAASPASTNGNWKVIEAPNLVQSVYGRTGAVVATSDDYTAAQVAFTPTGSIAATNVQDAIAEAASEASGGSTDASDLTSGTLDDARLSANVLKFTPGQTAVGTITMSGIAVADETFTVAFQTFTWKATRTGAGEVEIGTTALEAAQNIATAITEDLFGVLIPVAADSGGGIATVVVTAATFGQDYNVYVFAPSDSSNMTMDGDGFFGGTTVGVNPVGPAGTSLTSTSAAPAIVNNSTTLKDAGLRLCIPTNTAWGIHLVTSFSNVSTAGLKVSFGDADCLISYGQAAYFNTESAESPLAYQGSNVTSLDDGGALAASTGIGGGFLVLDAVITNLSGDDVQLALSFAQQTAQGIDTNCFGGSIVATRIS